MPLKRKGFKNRDKIIGGRVMKVCFPVLQSEGLQSEVYGHFGSAPAFVVIDFDSNELKTITNKDAHHAHGQCNPLKALDNHKVDAIVVGGIGAGALMKLNQQGVKVFRAEASSVEQNIHLLKNGSLAQFTSQNTCSGHSHSGSCGHILPKF